MIWLLLSDDFSCKMSLQNIPLYREKKKLRLQTDGLAMSLSLQKIKELMGGNLVLLRKYLGGKYN